MSDTDKLKCELYDEVVNEKNKQYIELACRFRETCNDIKKKDKEIERLNNIINELEKDFERKIQSCTIGAETTTNDFYCRLHIATLKKWLNKIQELKGSDKE